MNTMRLKRTVGLKRGPWRLRRRHINATPVSDGHHTFDSTAEYNDGKDLEIRQQAGEISDLRFHPKVVLIPARGRAPEIAWELDFSYVERGRTIWVDSKRRPMLKERERLLMKLWHHFGPGLLRVLGWRGKVTEIMPEAGVQR